MANAIRNLALIHLERRPEEAAPILERCSGAEVAALLGQASPAVAAAALARLSPHFAADCFAELPPEVFPAVLDELSPTAAAALLRHSTKAAREAALSGLSEKTAARVREALTHPADSAGALAATDALTLFGDLPVARAIDLLRGHSGGVPDRIPVLDRSRRVLGALRTARLCWEPGGTAVGSLTLEALHVIPARTPVATLLGDRRWDGPIPVVDRSGAFLGVLETDSVRHAEGGHGARPATELTAAFSELCWFGLTGALAGLAAGFRSSERAGEPERRGG